MMNVKKYRATTTREALEMIKDELGEDAFVLETKQVRSSGFLGFRSKVQVEVSAAAANNTTLPAKRNESKSGIPSHRILNLIDDAEAEPQAQPRSIVTNKRDALLSALSARVASNDFEKETPTKSFETKKTEIEAVEISSEAPRFVHPKREIAKPAVVVAETKEIREVVETKNEVSHTANLNYELEMLRAELREVKFSIGAFANRQAAHSWQSEVNLDTFGEMFETPFHEIYVELTATGLSAELARQFVAEAIPQYKNSPIDGATLLNNILTNALTSLIQFTPDFLESDSRIWAIIGATGVGKTTTIAKIAARAALQQQRRVELVTLDTYRIAAVEQLKTYAEIIGAGCHVVRSVFELEALLHRLPSDAIVLIDTTGKNPHDLADQFGLSEFLAKRSDIHKCLALQATTNQIDTANAIKKYAMYGVNSLAITKMDETMQPGAILRTVAEGGLPLSYICAGQRVPEDLQIATVENLIKRLIG